MIDDLFTTDARVIEESEVESKCSEWGNTFTIITKEYIDKLFEGKVLFIDDGEYGHFIKLKKEE